MAGSAFYRPLTSLPRPQLPQPRITLIAGPTASGKSRLALEMAERTGAVIINADSQQLYADLRILSARPSPADEAMVDHRLYGVVDGAETWSVGRWVRAIDAELSATDPALPVLVVGGTGLYFNALTRGLADIPAIPAQVRASVEDAFANEGEACFRRRLRELDRINEAAIASGDRQRLVRSMAVAVHTGRPASDWRTETRPLLAPDSWRGMVLEPPREQVYAACDERVTQIVAKGALDEVRALVDRDLDPAVPVMKAIGVPEFAAFLSARINLEQAVEATQQSTRRYAKRQLTWFRNQMPDWPRQSS